MNHAYVTFVMRNDSFIPGALVFAYALRKQQTNKDLICIASDKVSEQGINTLKLLFDDVIIIDEIYTPHKNRHERQDRPFLFTRFHALRLGTNGGFSKNYDKVLVCDADLLPLKDYDRLFDIDAPAGVINEFKEYCMESKNGQYVIPDSVYDTGTWIWHDTYKAYPFGSLIPKDITDRVLNDTTNMGMNAALYLFEPSINLFNDIIDDTNNPDTQTVISQYPWPEMQYITAKLSGKWHNMDLRFSSFNGYPIIDVLNGIHYAGLKPWQLNHRSIMHFAKNEDYRLWYGVFTEMMDEYNDLLTNPKLAKMDEKIRSMQTNPIYQFNKTTLPNVKHLFKR